MSINTKNNIGILALQGDVVEHQKMLERVGAVPHLVTLPKHLAGLDGLIIPGGESTMMAKMIDLYELREPLVEAVRSGMALWGTCAGMILVGQKVNGDKFKPLNLLDFDVERNWYGRQIDSFESPLKIRGLDGDDFKGVFIRAPAFTRIGNGLQVFSVLKDGTPVGVRQGRLLATAFHPELTGDERVHRLFLELANGKTTSACRSFLRWRTPSPLGGTAKKKKQKTKTTDERDKRLF